MTWRKTLGHGLRRGEEVLIEAQCVVLDSTGTSLPGAGTPVIVGVTDQRLIVWAVSKKLQHIREFLGAVSRSRILSVSVDRRGVRTAVLLEFEEQARLTVDAARESHPEQLAWMLTVETPHSEQ